MIRVNRCVPNQKKQIKARSICINIDKCRINHNHYTCYVILDADILYQNATNTMKSRQNGCYFADDIFKCIYLNEYVLFLAKISKFVSKGIINNILPLVHVMAWRRPGTRPLSEPTIVSSPTHICVARPQRVNVNSFRGSPTAQPKWHSCV